MKLKGTMKQIFVVSIFGLAIYACRNSANPENNATNAAASQAKIYSTDDVDKELKDGMVVIGGTREDAQTFFKAHSEFQVCQDLESFSVAVVRNTKVDPHADDIYVITNFERNGKIGAMQVGPPQFSVSNPASYCK
jgi:hypothetical protein